MVNMINHQCKSCGGFCKKSGCERENAQAEPVQKAEVIDRFVNAVFDFCKDDAEPVQEPAWLLESTKTLAKSMAKKFYPEVPQWQCLDDLAGVISQIDNMTTGLMRKPEPVQEPYCILYEWDGPFGLHQETNHRQYNGKYPDRSVKLYAAPQDGLRKAARQALEALLNSQFDDSVRDYGMQSDTIKALREALK
jgi:hypothetical protein